MKKSTYLTLVLVTSLSCANAQNSDDRIEAANGKVIGMTSSGGSQGYGVVYRYTTGIAKDSICTNQISSAGKAIFGAPIGNTLIRATNGTLYAMAQYGGLFGVGGLYSYNPSTNKDSLLLSFNWINGDEPQGGLMQASDGLLYGMTLYGGNWGDGALFSYNPSNGNNSVLVNFNGATGKNPYYGTLVQARDGNIYGLTEYGGTHNKGVIFRLNPVTKVETVVFSMDSTNGQYPTGGLVMGKDSMLYGMAALGGTTDSGVLFRFNPYTLQDSVLFNFNTATGAMPTGSLMQASNNLFYGMTQTGGANGKGTFFCYNTSTFKDSVLVNFNGVNGQAPNGDNRVIQGTNGILYGMAQGGGSISHPYGVLFSYNPINGNDSVLENFTNGNVGGVPGEYPYDALVQDTTGILYGVTQWGGTYGFGGTLFSYTISTKTFTTIVNLGGESSNHGYITQASNGMVYGMTSYGGTSSVGTLFEYNPITSATNILYSFDFTHGSAPYGKIMQASDGFLYGMTAHGDTDNVDDFGTIFRFDPNTNTEKVVLNFTVDSGGGREPRGGLIQATDGLLYGMTLRDQSALGAGVLFSFDPATLHKNKVLVKFNDTNGASPFGGLMQAKNKLLYGMTALGGDSNMGVLFSYNTVTHTDSVLVNFKKSIGAHPFGGLIQCSANGYLYGMTNSGGSNNNGVIFRFETGPKTDSVVFNFSGLSGTGPVGSFIQDSLGMLYSTTRYGGKYNHGVLFMFNPLTNKDSVLLNFDADSGANPNNIIFLNSALLSVQNIAEQKEMIVVYPNPFKDVATVLFDEPNTHYVEMDDMMGNQVVYLTSYNKQCEISRGSLATGMYIIKVYNSKKQFIASSKIMVQ